MREILQAVPCRKQRGRDLLRRSWVEFDQIVVGTPDAPQRSLGPDYPHGSRFGRRRSFTPRELQKPFPDAIVWNDPACRIISLGLGIEAFFMRCIRLNLEN